MKRMKKIIPATFVLSSALLVAPGFSSADTNTKNPVKMNAQEGKAFMAAEQGSVSISDWKDPFKGAFNALQQNNASYNIAGVDYYYKNETLTDLTLNNVYQSSVEADGSPTITSSNSLFAGKTTLTNSTDQDQVLTTNSFSKVFENSVTSSVTNGFNLGVTASSTFGIPLIGETSVQLSTEYNFSKTDANTKAESYTYTASPQNITVPAHSSVEVIVNLNTSKINGNVKLLSLVDGTYSVEGRDSNGRWYTSRGFLSNLADEALRYDKNLNISRKGIYDNKVYLVGHGKYSAEYGTEFSVTVKPVAKPSALASKSRSMVAENSKTTNEGYTYTVKPEVKKEQ
ncbi:ETX/MTX2 family pore-forming toxin (plasmid) [Bacillus tropicus]|uniref:ETX/MTX2 family pore-forming toxin n=1 Tax=Bacillus tropicus TaxID=2026188 RepID=UPI002006BA14|nr:ETX/MTX2 family pore-forming toxin [Bacillus tropicus]UOK49322.1 ETX/MTX2 family pore-forming toxin [Bacillus tropicus]